MTNGHLPLFQGMIVIAIGVYVALISTMVWRAIARVQLFDDLWTWTKLCSCAGAVVFALSDGYVIRGSREHGTVEPHISAFRNAGFRAFTQTVRFHLC